jgi:CRISPR-associated endonuclease/helicase Cas3
MDFIEKSEKQFIAHVRLKEDNTWDIPHYLSDHLRLTSELAESFATKFNSGEWGKVAGLAHDAGKARVEWQKYLKKKSGFDEEAHLEGIPGKMPHAIHGAILAEDFFKQTGRILSYCIAGHHAGLQDWSPEEEGKKSLCFQLTTIKDVTAIKPLFNDHQDVSLLPPWKFDRNLDLSLWVRMLYSCLVDADFLDTENYMDAGKTKQRGQFYDLGTLYVRFKEHVKTMEADADKTSINHLRQKIRERCIQFGQEPKGVFSLSVPTGGGKTLSSLAFAFEHAIKHQMDRIIYVIPYTSIIEQNATVFRKAIGEDQVIEHHSNLVEDENDRKSRLATENWDAPVVVTTSVQFFESLFAAKSSRCRKLHNVVNSVVILDEAQLLPVKYLEPILNTMQLLTDHYGVSFVICTATQPALLKRKSANYFFPGLNSVKEIMGSKDEIDQLYQSLERVKVELPESFSNSISWEELATELNEYKQVLCIVSDRKSCLTLFNLMPEGTIHLSALMCAQHRSEVIDEIKNKLKNNEAVRVISTQLVEAGVDIDFPVVYRALAGLDSIAQAAGRCNREGKLSSLGKVVVFVPPKKPPIGILRKAADTTITMFFTNKENPLNHNRFEEFFSELYWKANSWDEKQIMKDLKPDSVEYRMQFRTASKKFQMIEEGEQRSILVYYKMGGDLINQLRKDGPSRELMRKLQRYSVNVYNNQFYAMLQNGIIEEIYPNIYALVFSKDYSDKTGMVINSVSDPNNYIIGNDDEGR